MRTFRFRFVAVAALAGFAALPAPNALASRSKVSPGPQVTDKDFDLRNFSGRSTDVDNKFLPLVPGQQSTLTGTTTAGKHEVVFTVTDVTKWVDHVRTVVIWDRDFQDGVLFNKLQLSERQSPNPAGLDEKSPVNSSADT